MPLAWPAVSFAFQPIINVSTKSIVSFEALVRGVGNTSAHTVFDQIAEEDAQRFDEFLRTEAIHLAARLGIRCNLNLNVLPSSLAPSATAISSTIAAAHQANIPLEQITLEITEAEIIQNTGQFVDIINTYRDLGVTVAIDDFGAGYSGLNLLAEFQPDSIKIDMTLIRHIDRRGPRQAIVRGIFRTSQDLGIDVVIEGVETEEEYCWCADEGFELFQGYFFAKPGFEILPIAFYPGA